MMQVGVFTVGDGDLLTRLCEQFDGEGRTSARGGVEGGATAMRFGDASDDGESQASALTLTSQAVAGGIDAEERVPDLIVVGWFNAGTGIRDRQSLHLADRGYSDFDAPPRGGVLDRVGDEVAHGALHKRAVN